MTTNSKAYRDGYFHRDGIRLHFRDYPGPIDGPPLLCLPGLTRNARDFDDFARHWSPRYRVLTLEFRGRGESGADPLPERYIPSTYAHDTIALLDHVGVADAVFVGTSLGGLVAMLVAVLDEDRVAGAILNDIGPELSDTGIARIRGVVGTSSRGFANWGEAAAAVEANQCGLPKQWGLADWEAMARRLCSERDDGSIRFDYDPAIAEPFRSAPTGASVDMWPLFDALAQKPVLVLRGEHSDLLTPEVLQRMADRSPKVRTATIAEVGHAPELTEREAVTAITEFLTKID